MKVRVRVQIPVDLIIPTSDKLIKLLNPQCFHMKDKKINNSYIKFLTELNDAIFMKVLFNAY